MYVKALTGNEAVATAVKLCKPDVIAAYPITPQSSVVEKIAVMVNNGELDCEFVQVESEHTSMSILQGASMAGGRVFTATSGNGLHLMYEPYARQSTLRLPAVMALATRELMSPHTVFSGHQDAMIVRDAGWMQVYCENNQELLDMIIQAYKISENTDVLLPINVCYDGFYISHLTERVEVPDEEKVIEFIGADNYKNLILDPDNPMAVDPMTSGPRLMKFRESHLDAMQNALRVIDEVDKEFKESFGRSYGGAVDTYKCEDAETVIVTIGAMTGDAREAVDRAREAGIKVGLLKVRFIRPFPDKKVASILKGKKAFAVIDRSVSFGWNAGPLYVEVKSAVADIDSVVPNFSAIGGLGGSDLNSDHIYSCIEKLEDYKDDSPGRKETLWLE